MLNQAQFNAKLRSIRSSKMKDTIQDCIVSGLEQYRDCDANTGYLTDLVNTLVANKGFPTRAISDYIKAHANIVWVTTKKKDKDGVVSKVSRFKKAEKGASVVVTMPETVWYEHEANSKSNSVSEMDVDKAVSAFIKKVEKKLADGEVKNPSHAMTVLANLKKLAPQSETQKAAAKIEASEAQKKAADATITASKGKRTTRGKKAANA